MKRTIACSLVLAVVVAFAGCGDAAKVKKSETITTPGGTTTTTTEKTVESSGSNPPTNSSGERAKP